VGGEFVEKTIEENCSRVSGPSTSLEVCGATYVVCGVAFLVCGVASFEVCNQSLEFFIM